MNIIQHYKKDFQVETLSSNFYAGYVHIYTHTICILCQINK